jgi:outer membrane protein assembly factor BamB
MSTAVAEPVGAMPQAVSQKGRYHDVGTGIDADGTIYVGSLDDNLYAINPDCTKKWAFKTGAHVYSSPAIGADGTAYIGSDDENFYAIK